MRLSESIRETRGFLSEQPALHFEGDGLRTLLDLLQSWSLVAKEMEAWRPEPLIKAEDAAFGPEIFDDPKIVPFPARVPLFGDGS